MSGSVEGSGLAGLPHSADLAGLQAVLWDMDGTLVDTEPSWIAAEYRLVGRFGGSWNDEHAHALVGNPLLVSAAYLREHGGVDLPPPEIVDRLLAEVIADVRARTWSGAPACGGCWPRPRQPACRARW